MTTSFSTTLSDWQGVDDELIDGSRNLIDNVGISNLHYNKIQLAKSTNTDWSKVIVNAYVKAWIGGSKRLFFGQCYKNIPIYGSGILIFACDADFSNPSASAIINWGGAALGNVGVNVKGIQILPERDIIIDGITYGKLSVEVNWDAIPDGWNDIISPKYYLNIENDRFNDEIPSEVEKINKCLLNQVPYISGSLPMIDKTSELQWYKDCSPTLFANFLIDFKIVGTPQEGYEYSFRGFNYKYDTQGVTYYYCWFGIYKKEISSDTYSIVAGFYTSDVETGYKEYTINDMRVFGSNPTISDIKVALNWDAVVSLEEGNYPYLENAGYKFNQNYIFDLNVGPLAEGAKLKLIGDTANTALNTANDALDSVKDVNNVVFEDVVENLTNYESLLSGAFIRGSNHTIEVNQYTSPYKIYLFRLSAGDYIFETTGATPNSVDIIGIIDSMEDFQVGGVLSESILVGSPATSVSRTFNNETLVVLLSQTTHINYSGYIKKQYKQSKISIIEKQIEDIEEQISSKLKIVIPDTIYAVVDTELNLWNDAVSLSVDKGLCSPINYQIRWNCTKGLITDRCFRFTPSNEDAGHNYTCFCYLYDMKNNLIDSKQFTIKVLAKNALQAAKNIAYFGDSLGQAAAGQLYTDFHNSDKFTGVIPSMVGTKGTTYKYDAVGGYKWLDYATVGQTGYRASVSGVTSISLSAVYTDGVSNFEVIEVNIVDGVGNILLQSHYTHYGTLIMPSGTLTKVSGGGDNTVTYTDAFEESANPLWNDTTQQLDAAQYKRLVGLQSTDKIDAVSFQFGVNDAANHDMDNILTYIDSLYHCFVDDNPNCKFIIGLNTSAGNDVNGSGSNYGASFNWISYLEYSYKIRQLYMTLQNNQNYPNIRIAPINLQVDRYYGYNFGTRPISQRYNENEQYHNNYVHPGSSGYGQMGDAYFATYIGVLTE